MELDATLAADVYRQTAEYRAEQPAVIEVKDYGPTPDTQLGVAVEGWKLGLRPFPCWRAPHVNSEGEDDTGHPKVGWRTTWLDREIPLSQVVEWFEPGDVDVFFETGPSVCAADGDDEAAVKALVARVPRLKETTCVVTRRGAHFYFRLPAGRELTSWDMRSVGIAVDIKGTRTRSKLRGGAGIMAPGSIGKDGRPKVWKRGWDCLITLTEDELRLLEDPTSGDVGGAHIEHGVGVVAESDHPKALGALASEMDRLRAIEVGGQISGLRDAAWRMGQIAGAGYLLDATAFEAMRSVIAEKSMWGDNPELTMERSYEAGKLAPRFGFLTDWISGRVSELEAGDSGAGECTDLGNARRLVGAHGKELRYARGLGWLVWNGRVWAQDETGEVERRAQDVARNILYEAASIDDPDKRQRVGRWATTSQSAAKLGAMVELAKSQIEVAARVSDFNSDPWLLTCASGTIDLRSGMVRGAWPEDLITVASEMSLGEAGAATPMWDAFLSRVCCGDKELEGYLQRVAGYVLTGMVSEQCLFFLVGMGANGKSAFILVLQALLGGLGVAVDPEMLMAMKHDKAHPANIAALMGKRLAVPSEIDEGKYWAEAQVKRLTGGDRIPARYMNRDWFEFAPTHKFVLSGNHKPSVRGSDDGIWRRFRLIGFGAEIPESEQIVDLWKELIRVEGGGILRWAVQGCLDWQRVGLREPEGVVRALAEYRSGEDVLGRFIEERLATVAGARLAYSQLVAEYADWARENGHAPMGARELPKLLMEHRAILGAGTVVTGEKWKLAGRSVKGLTGLTIRQRG